MPPSNCARRTSTIGSSEVACPMKVQESTLNNNNSASTKEVYQISLCYFYINMSSKRFTLATISSKAIIRGFQKLIQ
ncbi:hypothetical protein ACOSP7_004144 [Xanthoceras sorbifolium]